MAESIRGNKTLSGTWESFGSMERKSLNFLRSS